MKLHKVKLWENFFFSGIMGWVLWQLLDSFFQGGRGRRIWWDPLWMKNGLGDATLSLAKGGERESLQLQVRGNGHWFTERKMLLEGGLSFCMCCHYYFALAPFRRMYISAKCFSWGQCTLEPVSPLFGFSKSLSLFLPLFSSPKPQLIYGASGYY